MHRYKILLVDDSESVLSALKRLFVSEGYEVILASSAKEAIQLLSQHQVDVLITDQNMPGTSGTELLETTLHLFKDVVRIMLTGETDIDVAKKAINDGEIFRFFVKPWDDFELTVAVKNALRQKELERENAQLKSTVKNQSQILHKLEQEFPGISDKSHSEDGVWVIED
jgi:two-component system, probable response regulator PhcQ